MDGPSQPERAQQRQRRDRDLVKGAALLLSTDRPLPDLYDEFVSLLAQFVDASIVLILAPERGALQCVYAYLDGVGGIPDNPGVPHDSTSARVFRDVDARIYGHAREWNATNYLRLGERIREPESAIFVPILFGGRSIGVLSVQSTSPEAYDADDLALLETCALYLGARMHSDLGRRDAERFVSIGEVDPPSTHRRHLDEHRFCGAMEGRMDVSRRHVIAAWSDAAVFGQGARSVVRDVDDLYPALRNGLGVHESVISVAEARMVGAVRELGPRPLQREELERWRYRSRDRERSREGRSR